MKDLIVLRTNTYSAYWEKNLQVVKDFFHIIIIADERQCDVGFNDFLKVQFTYDTINQIGLSPDKDMYWRCGDYALYLADSLNLNYRYLWLLEPDVYFNDISLKAFLEKFDSVDSDLLTSYFNEAPNHWPWYEFGRNISGENDVYQCFFPMTRFSKNLVKFLRCNRSSVIDKINDECYVANIISGKEYSVSEFSESPGIIYNKNSFSYRLPHYIKLIRSRKYNLYHPVMFNFNDFLNHMFKKGSWKKVIKNIFIKNNED